MADLPDVSGVDPNAGSFPVLPRGQYPVHIYDSEKKTTSDGEGEYLRLYMEVIQGEHSGQKMAWCDLNLWNRSQQAVEIAQRQLAQICHATNTVGARDSAAFHHKAMIADVDVQPARNDPRTGKSYGERNIYRRFLPINGTAQPAASGAGGIAAATAVSTPAATARGSAPWRR
jgi:hypothetical protein